MAIDGLNCKGKGADDERVVDNGDSTYLGFLSLFLDGFEVRRGLSELAVGGREEVDVAFTGAHPRGVLFEAGGLSGGQIRRLEAQEFSDFLAQCLVRLHDDALLQVETKILQEVAEPPGVALGLVLQGVVAQINNIDSGGWIFDGFAYGVTEISFSASVFFNLRAGVPSIVLCAGIFLGLPNRMEKL